MKSPDKNIKTLKIIFRTIAVIVLIIGLSFSYLIAKLEDAPGIVLIGTAITLVGASLVYGIGEIIAQLKKNSRLLSDIQKELTKKR
jgi:hypothetical protein